MTNATRMHWYTGALLVTCLAMTSGCKGPEDTANAATGPERPAERSAHHVVQSGTPLAVALVSEISSESASVLQTWRGTLAEDVVTHDGDPIAAGSTVTGVITSVASARRGSRASLTLEVRGIRVNGRDESINAEADPIVAGSTRTRNVGAVAGGAVAGALIGKVVGDGKNAAVGGLLGGAAAAGVVAGSKGYQVVLQPGRVVEFTVTRTVSLR